MQVIPEAIARYQDRAASDLSIAELVIVASKYIGNQVFTPLQEVLTVEGASIDLKRHVELFLLFLSQDIGAVSSENSIKGVSYVVGPNDACLGMESYDCQGRRALFFCQLHCLYGQFIRVLNIKHLIFAFQKLLYVRNKLAGVNTRVDSQLTPS